MTELQRWKCRSWPVVVRTSSVRSIDVPRVSVRGRRIPTKTGVLGPPDSSERVTRRINRVRAGTTGRFHRRLLMEIEVSMRRDLIRLYVRSALGRVTSVLDGYH